MGAAQIRKPLKILDLNFKFITLNRELNNDLS